MINYLKPINSSFALGLIMRKKYAQNTLVVDNAGKTSATMRKSEN